MTAIEVRMITKSVKDGVKDLSRVSASAKKTDSATKKLNTTNKKMSGIYKDVSGRLREANGRFKEQGKATKALHGGILRLAGAYLTFRAALRIIRNLAEFSDKLLELKAVSGATEDQLESMTTVILRLGATTRFTATEVAAAMTNLARAGFSAEESMAAVASTLNLAQAGVIGIAEAAKIASTSVRQFGLEAQDVGRIADALVTAANNSNTTVTGLSEAMKFAGPVARALGISIEETASLLGVLADAGLDATLGGTGLRMTMLRLAAPASKARKVIKEMGLSLADIDPRIVGVEGAMRKLAEAGLDVTS
ncbi:MAG: phage tail tape measure protein, partial [Deltaproteobacteria bacterium]|nr:phage tail tape measure protein [Deltaproteobacteria bacterium]